MRQLAADVAGAEQGIAIRRCTAQPSSPLLESAWAHWPGRSPVPRGWLGGCAILLLALLSLGAAPASRRAQVSVALDHTALGPSQQAVVAVVIDVPEGLHIQSHTPSQESFIKLQVKLNESPAYTALAPKYPPGQVQEYPVLGKLNVNTGRVIVYVPIQVSKDAQPGSFQIGGQVVYQACDQTACYPQQRPTFTLDTRIAAPGEPVQPANAELFAAFQSQASDSYGSYLLAFASALVVGILLNVMPCVLPVVPLKAIGFYEVSKHNRARSLELGAVFSAGIIATFAVLAVLVLMLHMAWGQLFANRWFLGAIAAVLLAMALSMFGAFAVGLPAGIYRFSPRHDTIVGNFLFGILTAILSTPCTFGMFFGLLVWASAQPTAIGVPLVMTVGVGMACPYFVLSAFPELARRFPRTGPWAALVKEMMGFLLLASAVYFARRFAEDHVGAAAYWWTLFTVIAAAGVHLVVRTWQFARTAIGPVVAVLIAVAFVSPALAVTWRLAHPPIAWQPYSPAALAAAQATGRPVLVEFTADWCGNCTVLEATVFYDRQVAEAIRAREVVPLRADITEEGAPGWELLRQLSPVAAIPLTAVYQPGKPAPRQLSGIYSVSDLIGTLSGSQGSTGVAEVR